METVNAFQILSYGVIGLGFLLALLAYRLLAREQQGEPRQAIIKAIYYFMGFSVTLCLIGFAAQVYPEGSTPAPPPDCSAVEEKRDRLRAKMDELKASTIKIEDLVLISDEHFDRDAKANEILAGIRRLVKGADAHDRRRRTYTYRLFELETMFRELGGNISTRIRGPGRKRPYSKIQEVLQDIGYYDGPIDGDQTSTNQALVRFQMEYNEQAGEEIFNTVKDLGFFGYRTLEAVRSAYRRNRA